MKFVTAWCKDAPVLHVPKKSESQLLFSVAADHNVHSVYLVLSTSVSNITNCVNHSFSLSLRNNSAHSLKLYKYLFLPSNSTTTASKTNITITMSKVFIIIVTVLT